MAKVVREYTFEGPEDWLRFMLGKSLRDGEQDFLKNSPKRITVKTTHSDLADPVEGAATVTPAWVMDLGYANGWVDIPPIVAACKELGHIQGSRTEGNCLTRYGCSICGFSFLVDSSG